MVPPVPKAKAVAKAKAPIPAAGPGTPAANIITPAQALALIEFFSGNQMAVPQGNVDGKVFLNTMKMTKDVRGWRAVAGQRAALTPAQQAALGSRDLAFQVVVNVCPAANPPASGFP